MYRSVVDAVYRNSKISPHKLAVADKEKAYTYAQLIEEINHVAGYLEKMSIGKGETVLVECTQDANFLVLDMACQLLGVIFVPIEKKAVTERIADIYKETNAICIIGEKDFSKVGKFYFVREIMQVCGDCSVDVEAYIADNTSSMAEILFTTGTTGQPKGIVISHAANVAIGENISYGVEMTANTVELVPMPLSHSHGLRTCYANFLTGSAVVIIDGVMNVSLFFELIDKYDVNALDISPTLAKLLLKIARKGLIKCSDSIDYIEIGTAVLEDDTKMQLKSIFRNTRLYNFYGSTEAGRSCVLDFNLYDETGCIGYPSKNSTFYIVDEERRAIQSSKDNPGLIAVSGKMMMEGYLNSEALTKQTVVNGILYTTDLGYVDELGRIYVIGRADDIINYKGIKISPEEIENVAGKYQGILDCACVPAEDAVCGQVPKLFIKVSSNDFDERLFWDYLKANLEQSRVPVSIKIIDLIPRSSNGKLQRKKLRGTDDKRL